MERVGSKAPGTPPAAGLSPGEPGWGGVSDGAGRRRNLGNVGGAGGWQSSGAAGSEESQPRWSRSAAMGQIEWAMWANEQALASGLSE